MTDRPIICGYDGDGEVWVERCGAASTAADALVELARQLQEDRRYWRVRTLHWLKPGGGDEWVEATEESRGARPFWHATWRDGPAG